MLVRLREVLGRPVAWGAVLLSYLGIFAGFAFAVYTYDSNGDALREEARVRAVSVKLQGDAANARIVETGRAAIKSGCIFDNQRARELRGILRGNARRTQFLVEEGTLTQAQADRAIADAKRAARKITVRDCAKAANILSSEPKEK